MAAMEGGLAGQLRALDADVFPGEEREAVARMLAEHARARCAEVNRRDARAWAAVRSRADWERFVAPRLAALRASLGPGAAAPGAPEMGVTRTVEGDGFRIENGVYESGPGVLVTANLYLPAPLRERMPAIVLIHSHHNPKTQGELQDMGMTWARQGCAVLVPDLPGYGERREGPEGPRQEYRFRAIIGIQLCVTGESLMGWIARDIRRGIDLLLGRGDVDPERVIVIGAVAGGGDPAAVVAALDRRVACAIPFNFGGPQPETPYPLPDDAEQTFNYMGSGSWESTRNLRRSGRDGFLPWVIVALVAPRRLVYAHEFSWDRERDPVWKRLQRIYGLYDAGEKLAFAHGAGLLAGRPPEATHCNNVGATHRRMIYPALERWFGIPASKEEYSQRLAAEELACLPRPPAAPAGEPAEPAPPRPLHALLHEIGAGRAAAARAALEALPPEARREQLRREWAGLLGEVEPVAEPRARSHAVERRQGFCVDRVALEVEAGIVVPVLLLLPEGAGVARRPVVVGLVQQGKGAFLRERAEEIAGLLERGVAVCLPDVRGTGETEPDSSRDARSPATAIAATELMLGETLLGARLRDTRTVLRWLGAREDVDAGRLALWGDSFAPANPPGFAGPLLGEGEQPRVSEPLGGLLALFGALYEEGVRAAAARGTLVGYESVLRDRFCYVPHDAVVPGALTAGDLCDVAAALAPRPLRLGALVDGRNCPVGEGELRRVFEPAVRAYQAAAGELVLLGEARGDLAAWLARALAT